MNKKTKNEKSEIKKRILKIVVIVISVSVIAAVFFAFYPFLKELKTPEGRLSFKEKISNMGFSGFLLIYALETVQILLVVIPGEPIEFLYGMCYGKWLGALFITITVFINTIIVYLIVKKFGRKILVFFFSEEKVRKIEKSKLYNDSSKIEKLMMILFFLPGTPKDFLLYIGALTPIKMWKFVLISTFVRFPSVITSTIAGDAITSNDLRVTIGSYVVMGVILGIIMLLTRNGKSKESQDIRKAMEELK